MTSDSEKENVPRQSRIKMVLGIVAAVILLVMGAIALQIDDWSRDWTQNTASLQAEASRPELRPQTYSLKPEELVAQIESFVESRAAWDLIETQWASARGESRLVESDVVIKLTRTTGLFQFVDDITVRISQDESGTVTMNAESQSRVGKGDLGQNPRNLVELVSGLKS